MVSVSASHAVAPSEVRATDWSSSPREQMVSSYGPLVRRLSRRFWASKEPPEDLFQIGVIGLLRAIDKFDPSRGSSFASLAIPEILGSILNYLRDHGGPCKVPRALRSNMLAVRRASERLASQLGRWPTEAELAESCHLTERQVRDALEFGRTVDARSLDQMLGGDDGDGSGTLSERLGGEDAQFDQLIDRMAIAAALDLLTPKERTIVVLKFYQDLSQTQIAERIEVSQVHVSRLQRRALAKLRGFLEQPAPARMAGEA